MFREELKDKLSQIFGLRKATFDAPSMNASTGTFEQEVLFIQIDETKSRPKYGKVTAIVSGTLIVFSQMDKMPFGYFSKRIEQASPELKKDFFFFDIDQNPANSPARFLNISERRLRFQYLYSAQYDPEHGELTSVEGL